VVSGAGNLLLIVFAQFYLRNRVILGIYGLLGEDWGKKILGKNCRAKTYINNKFERKGGLCRSMI
jgi:hypothetical protein